MSKFLIVAGPAIRFKKRQITCRVTVVATGGRDVGYVWAHHLEVRSWMAGHGASRDTLQLRRAALGDRQHAIGRHVAQDIDGSAEPVDLDAVDLFGFA